MSDVALTGAVEEVTIAGTKYRMSSLSDKDIVELDIWLQQRIVAVARESLDGVTDQTLRDETLAVAMRTAMATSWISPLGAQVLATPEGMARVLYQSAQKNAKHDLDMGAIRQAMQHSENVLLVNMAFTKLNLAGDDERPPDKGKKSRPTTARSRRGG
jgi:hypothetical protein